ncbi:fungal specific transcription factor domain-containing protein [Aspergillus mulundensis]|uniref:Nucleus protein n=1 Tax=Aspergillus mulundensis TaxID=1810919 RepID=A0A3D8R0B0_9EURO|nr:Nucleus protein [Aspergillus mulundensis]RDW67467.1 Nucleus protein [Aspergillus mulundensis]
MPDHGGVLSLLPLPRSAKADRIKRAPTVGRTMSDNSWVAVGTGGSPGPEQPMPRVGRCNRQQPCLNCIRRHIPHLCNPAARAAKRRERRIDAISPVRQTSEAESEVRSAGSLSDARSQAADASVGNLWPSRGAPSYHGNSYFGHQAAATMMQVPSPDIPVGLNPGRIPSTGATRSFRNERGPYAHVWEMIGHLPRQKAVVDGLTERFLMELNGVFDGVHAETFRTHYENFWDRRRGWDDMTNVDLRWLSLLFIILAFSELLGCPQPCSVETQQDREESSLHFYWAARKCVVISPTFSGESADLVRAGILITRYNIYLGRVPESWTTVSFAVRMAQAQGMHIDGERWGLPRKVLETRRRLWSTLYYLDRTIALAVGRPYTVNDKHCEHMKITNTWVDDLDPDNAAIAEPKALSDPTPSIYHLYQQKLASILGSILDDCFALTPRSTAYSTYERALDIDQELLAWAQSLPSYFQLEDPDRSMDSSLPVLPWHRLYLHSAYYFARVTLHRPYVLLPSITGQFKYSQDVCFASACAHLTSKLSFRAMTMAERLKFNIVAHHFSNSALVLAVMAVRDPHFPRTMAIVTDLQSYCEKQYADRWVNEFQLAEVKVVELCVSRIKASSRYRGTHVLDTQGAVVDNVRPSVPRPLPEPETLGTSHEPDVVFEDMTGLSRLLECGTWEEIMGRMESEIAS